MNDENKSYSWPQVRKMGMAMGHGVATHMTDTDPTSIGSLIDRGISAWKIETAENINGNIQITPLMPITYDGNDLSYCLGSWIEAQSSDGKEWELWFQEDLIPHIGERIESKYGFKWTSEMEEWIENYGPIGLIEILVDELPADHYSGKAYRELMKLLEA